jgi:hypothetical protein
MSAFDDHALDFTSDERFLFGVGDGDDSGCVTVETAAQLRGLCAEILGRRERPVIGLTLGLDDDDLVLIRSDVRALVGADVPIYVICDEELLHSLRERLGARLAINRGEARVWWPGATVRSDPSDHPAVLALEGESPRVTLEEFAQQFELSSPRVRGQIRLIEDSRAFLEHELTLAEEKHRKVNERLRDLQIECHGLRSRLEAAEARLAGAERPSGGERP